MRRTAGGAAAEVVQVPGVAGGAVVVVEADGRHPELRHRRNTHCDRPQCLQRRHRGAVNVRVWPACMRNLMLNMETSHWQLGLPGPPPHPAVVLRHPPRMPVCSQSRLWA